VPVKFNEGKYFGCEGVVLDGDFVQLFVIFLF
jgi:hypothetical protein